MHIAFITSNYPSPSHPTNGTFVQQFVWAMARYGHECSVINPVSLFDLRFGTYPPRVAKEDAGSGRLVLVYRPRYISFSSLNLGWTHTGRWTQSFFNYAVKCTINSLPTLVNIVYGHFLYLAGFASLRIGELLGVPSVSGVGESSPWTLEAYGTNNASKHFEKKGYFLANSIPNMEMLVNQLGISSARILIEPNGVDLKWMYPRNSQEMKKKYAITTDNFIVAFVGANDSRKGPDRLIEAIESIEDVNCILMGRDTEALKSIRIIMSGPVSHKIVPELISCADIFVLPTMNEGSCNAVIEAMACGLPIVTSNGRYMDDIVDDEVAIRVDPTNVGEIREAIIALKNNPERRKRMSEACLRKAMHFDINERALRVTKWINELIRQTS